MGPVRTGSYYLNKSLCNVHSFYNPARPNVQKPSWGSTYESPPITLVQVLRGPGRCPLVKIRRGQPTEGPTAPP